MLPKTVKHLDTITGILAGFPTLDEDDFEHLNLLNEKEVKDCIKSLYMTLMQCHIALTNMKIVAQMEMNEYLIVKLKDTENS